MNPDLRRAVQLAAAVLIVADSPAFGAKPSYMLTGKVVAIADGDTLTVLDETNTQHTIRRCALRGVYLLSPGLGGAGTR